MKHPPLAGFIPVLILIVIFLITTVVFLQQDSPGDFSARSSDPVEALTPTHADVHLKGVTLRRGSGNGVLCTLSIGEMKVVKKKVGFFRIGGLRQLEVDHLDVRIDVSDVASPDGSSGNPSECSTSSRVLAEVLHSFKSSLESMTGGIPLAGLEGPRLVPLVAGPDRAGAAVAVVAAKGGPGGIGRHRHLVAIAVDDEGDQSFAHQCHYLSPHPAVSAGAGH